MSQPNIICLVRKDRRKALRFNVIRTEAPRGVDSRQGEGPERDGWRGGQARRLRAGAVGGHDGVGGTPTGGVGLYASPLPPPLAILAFRQPH